MIDILIEVDGHPQNSYNGSRDKYLTFLPTQEASLKYKGIISSDWNECLAPSGPFDPIAFAYPELETDLRNTFNKYTSNEISLRQASDDIRQLLPEPFSERHMDNFLDQSFSIYRGVSDLIEWASEQQILFMINTTGMQGFFQRALTKKVLPDVPIIAANPLISYSRTPSDSRYRFKVSEIDDKPKNTIEAMRNFYIPSGKAVVIGDSGGDGPHFEWGARSGALLIGSMTKVSLSRYCERKQVQIDQLFGKTYLPGQERNVDEEYEFNFMDLAPVIEDFIGH